MASKEKAEALEAAQLHILGMIAGAPAALGASKAVNHWANAYALLEGSVKPVSAYEQED